MLQNVEHKASCRTFYRQDDLLLTRWQFNDKIMFRCQDGVSMTSRCREQSGSSALSLSYTKGLMNGIRSGCIKRFVTHFHFFSMLLKQYADFKAVASERLKLVQLCKRRTKLCAHEVNLSRLPKPVHVQTGIGFMVGLRWAKSIAVKRLWKGVGVGEAEYAFYMNL